MRSQPAVSQQEICDDVNMFDWLQKMMKACVKVACVGARDLRRGREGAELL